MVWIQIPCYCLIPIQCHHRDISVVRKTHANFSSKCPIYGIALQPYFEAKYTYTCLHNALVIYPLVISSHHRYGRPLNEPTESGEGADQYNPHGELHIDIDDENINGNDEDANAVYERRSRSTMLLTSSFKNICPPEESESREPVERCTSTEVCSRNRKIGIFNFINISD